MSKSKASRGGGKRELEDPNNTWNYQLVAACLAGDLEECTRLVCKGADPVRAREFTPFTDPSAVAAAAAVTTAAAAAAAAAPTKGATAANADPSSPTTPTTTTTTTATTNGYGMGSFNNNTISNGTSNTSANVSAIVGRVSPLAAVLLQGDLSPGHLAAIKFLMERGASLDDTFALPLTEMYTTAVPVRALHEQQQQLMLLQLQQGGGGGGDTVGVGLAAAPVSRTATPELQQQRDNHPSRGGGGGGGGNRLARGGTMKGVDAVSPTAANDDADGAAALAAAAAATRLTPRELEAALAEADRGTALHYAAALGDHAHLLQLLMVLTGQEPSNDNKKSKKNVNGKQDENGNGGVQQRCIPHSLLAEVELEMAIAPPADAAADAINDAAADPLERATRSAGGGRSSSRGTSARRISRTPGGEKRQQQQQQQQQQQLLMALERENNRAGRAAVVVSALPTLRRHAFKPVVVVVDNPTAIATTTPTTVATASPTGRSGAVGQQQQQQPAAAVVALTSDLVRLLPCELIRERPKAIKETTTAATAVAAAATQPAEADVTTAAAAAAGTGAVVDGDTTTAATTAPAVVVPRLTVNLEARTTRSGLTALEIAVMRRDVLAVRLLTYYGAAGCSLYPTTTTQLEKEVASVVVAVAAGGSGGTVASSPSPSAANLNFYPPVNGHVNGTQTLLSRACASGDIAVVEFILDAGIDSLSHCSAEGRYTLIHWAAGQPAVLQYLVRRGLSGDAENAFGESALVSLIRHGTGRNAEGAARAPACPGDAARLAALPRAALQNYILTPPPPSQPVGGGTGGGNGNGGNGQGGKDRASSRFSVISNGSNGGGGGGSGSGRSAARGAGNNSNHSGAGHSSNRLLAAGDTHAEATGSAPAVVHDFRIGGGGPTGTWFSFTSLPTADLIYNVITFGGASASGFVPDDELDLAHAKFSEETERDAANNASTIAFATSTAAAVANTASGAFASSSPSGGGGHSGRMGNNNGHGGAVGSNHSSFRSFSSPAGPGAGSRSRSPSVSGGRRSSRAARKGSDGGRPMAGNGFDDSHNNEDAYCPTAAAASSSPPLQQSPRVASTAALLPGRLPLRATPLMHAIMNYHPELIRKLVCEYKAEVLARDSQGASALHYAAQCPQPSVMELLLSPLATIAASGGGGGGGGSSLTSAPPPPTFVIPAANANTASGGGGGLGSPPPQSPFISGPMLLHVNDLDMSGRTPLHYAAAVGNSAVVRLLLGLGLTVQAGRADGSGLTALHLAVLADSATCVDALAGHSDTVLAALQAAATGGGGGGGGFSPYGNAASGGGGGSKRQGYVSSGGGARSNASSSTSRRASVSANSNYNGTINAFQQQLSELAMVEMENEDCLDGATPLEMATKYGADPRVVRLLLHSGGASYLRPSGLESGGSLVHRVVADDQVQYLRLLLEHYADVNETDADDNTPLALALDRPSNAVRVDVVATLMEFGARPHAQSATTLRTPLHIAATRGHGQDVLALLFFEKNSGGGGGGNRSTSRRALGRRRSSSQLSVGGGSSSVGDSSGYDDGSGGGGSSVPYSDSDKYDDDDGEDDESERPVEAAVGRSAAARRARDRLAGATTATTRITAARRGDGTRGSSNHHHHNSSSSSRPRLLNPEYLFLLDAHGRTPFQLLCGHDDPVKQESALAVLSIIIGNINSNEDGNNTELYNSDGDRDVEPFARHLCLLADARGRLPLHDACRGLFPDAVALLLSAEPSAVLHVAGCDGSTALHEAITGAGKGGSSSSGTCDGDENENGSEQHRSNNHNEHDEKSLDVRLRRVTAAIWEAANACLPARMAGYAAAPASSSAGHNNNHSINNDIVRGSITAQLQSSPSIFFSPLYKSRDDASAVDAFRGATDTTAAAASASGVSANPFVRSWRHYLSLVDDRGRTALLVAGEEGNVAASRTLLRLSAV